jgi:hypothetical protein
MLVYLIYHYFQKKNPKHENTFFRDNLNPGRKERRLTELETPILIFLWR